MRYSIIFFLLSISINLNAQNKRSANLVIANAKIITGPFTDSFSAMVVDNGKVLKLYKDNSWKNEFDPEQIKDLNGKYVLPSFIDGHCHFLGLGKAMDEVMLFGSESMEEVVSRVKTFIMLHPRRQWIFGRGWDQNLWTEKTLPDNRMLDSMFPSHYIVLSRIDGHALLAGTKVLQYAGIDKNSHIEGGRIELKNGRPTGVLVDKASDLLVSKIPKTGHSTKIKWLLNAQNECIKYGISQVADAGLSLEDISLIDSLCDEGALKLRFYLMANPDSVTLDHFKKNGPLLKDRVHCNSIKIYSDGALGSRGALLKKPYCDDPENYGLQLIQPVELKQLLKEIFDMGFQANTHCIGDSANALVLRAYASQLSNRKNDRRWRIEHAQVVSPSDMALFENCSIIPSIQPTHSTSDMNWAENRLCKQRMNEAYAYRSLLEKSGYVVLGTDFPVEYVSPFNTIRSSIYRKDPDGKPENGFYIDESLTRNQTFAGMTVWAAKGNFWEMETGSLETGKWADFIVMDENPYRADPQKLKELSVRMLFISGRQLN
ncbi:MAG: amidohydrolase [Flavobacteriales bacterium]|nr:amidohydrolase [Flavobacteriales bacterium]